MTPIESALRALWDCKVVRVKWPWPARWRKLALRDWAQWDWPTGSVADFRLTPKGIAECERRWGKK